MYLNVTNLYASNWFIWLLLSFFLIPSSLMLFHLLLHFVYIKIRLVLKSCSVYEYCVTVFIFKLWFTVKYLCIQTFYRVESDWVNNNLEIGIQVIIFSSLVCEEYPSFTSQGCFSDWYVSFKISAKLSKFPVINSIGS